MDIIRIEAELYVKKMKILQINHDRDEVVDDEEVIDYLHQNLQINMDQQKK
jgi:hypothetical protein